MKFIYLILAFIFLFSCQKKSKYQLDPKSEMAQRMLDMHDDLKQIQEKIKEGKDLGNYPQKYQDFASLEMTQENMRKDGFEAYAMALLESEKLLYATDSPEEQKKAYQQVVNNCLACHQAVACTGPIPKIKKLAWKD